MAGVAAVAAEGKGCGNRNGVKDGTKRKESARCDGENFEPDDGLEVAASKRADGDTPSDLHTMT